MASQAKVLVTGGTGYLAAWIIRSLLDQGFAVRTTVRRPDRADAVKAMFGNTDRLEIVAADLLDDAGWPAATSGMTYLIHTAAPMMAKGPELLAASRDGTRRVLEAALANGVQRVVVTSSGYAVQPSPGPRGSTTIVDETAWADTTAPASGDYARAKTLTEKAVWDFAAAHPEMEISTVLPGFMLGPILSREIAPSMVILDSMLKGKLPAIPEIGMSAVDVRDAADLHIRAMTDPAGSGQRFLASAGFLWFRDIAAILRRDLGADAQKVATRRMPDWVVRAIALAVPPMRDFVPRLGRTLHLDNQKARSLLDWQPRPLEQTILDGARDLLARGD